MAVQVNLNDAQFRAFTQFAASVSDKGTVLKANDKPLTAPDGTPRKIVAKGYDGYGHIWRKQCHNATGTYEYENEFEFDLSDENEAKLAVAHLSQKLGMPDPDGQAEQPNDIHMPGIGEE